ncbi:MAG: DUF3784 domain-containing protein [Methanomassiliicoccus sp.]|nr:DUF3784 domain-containing protein [Methanomassiliicoccus sp.]
MDRSTKFLLLAVIASIAAPLVLFALLWGGSVDEVDLIVHGLIIATILPLIVISMYMWKTGKGAMLIAGYNTSPKAVRDSYDSKALAKFVGKILTITLVIMLVALEMLLLNISTNLFWALLSGSMIFLFASIIYMNTGKRFLKEGAELSKVVISDKDRKRNRAIVLAAIAITAITLVAVFFFAGSGSVSASLEDDGLQVNAPFVDEHIPYDDITAVELRGSFDNGRRVGGFGGSDISSGNFQNDEFGRYVLARFNNVESCIVVHHSGGVLVFNLDTADGTARMHDDLRSRL